ncbi:MAG: mechanosensitive ion channel family protein [Bacteroidota bacterium]
MTRLAGIDISVPPLLAIPLLVGVLAVLALLVGRLAARLGRAWFPTGASGGDQAPETPRLALPITVAVFAAGLLMLSPEFAGLGARGHWLRLAVTVLLVFTCAVGITRLAVAGVSVYAERRPALAPATSVARMAARIVIGILAVLTGLQALGVPVTPLLTTLGIGSLAVALALQDTLANFFSGLYLLADRPVRPGDYVKLGEGTAEGYVESIGWRSSRLRTLKGNTVIVPNQKLSQSILTNYHLPLPDMALIVPITVPYEADAAAVEEYLMDELRKAGRDLPQLLSQDPAVRLADLGPSGMVFQCIARVRDFEAQGPAAHELRRRFVARLKREGVDFGYPQQVVHDARARGRQPENRET